MTTLTQLLTSAEHTIAQDAPIFKKNTFNIITAIYQWGKTHPRSATALIAFVVGFILGSIF